MFPSDQFVRFYNEVFKFIAAKGKDELEKYYERVSKNQEYHCLDLFCKKGLQGMYEYWEHIRIEENCDMEIFLEPECFHSKMAVCPSLTKVTDNDGGACPKYCDHCPGWILPLMTKAGFFAVYNIIDRKKPVCEFFVYEKQDSAQKKLVEMLEVYSEDVIKCNF